MSTIPNKCQWPGKTRGGEGKIPTPALLLYPLRLGAPTRLTLCSTYFPCLGRQAGDLLSSGGLAKQGKRMPSPPPPDFTTGLSSREYSNGSLRIRCLRPSRKGRRASVLSAQCQADGKVSGTMGRVWSCGSGCRGPQEEATAAPGPDCLWRKAHNDRQDSASQPQGGVEEARGAVPDGSAPDLPGLCSTLAQPEFLSFKTNCARVSLPCENAVEC